MARDALSWEVMTGLRWAKFCLTENSPPTWSEKRAIASLKAAAINARDALHLDDSCFGTTVVGNSDDDNEDDDDHESKIGRSKRSSSSLRRSSRLVKRPCTINL